MGLNSFITNIISTMSTILIPKHYINYGTTMKSKHLYKTEYITRLLCEDCYIDISNGTYCKHNYRKVVSDTIKHYFGKGKHLFMNRESLYKSGTNQIPLDHKTLYITRKHYKIQENSQLTLVVETCQYTNNDGPTKTTTYAIHSSKNIDPMNTLVKEELCSLVSLFN